MKAVDAASGRVLAIDRQTAVQVDLSEQLAGKAALQEAAARDRQPAAAEDRPTPAREEAAGTGRNEEPPGRHGDLDG